MFRIIMNLLKKKKQQQQHWKNGAPQGTTLMFMGSIWVIFQGHRIMHLEAEIGILSSLLNL